MTLIACGCRTAGETYRDGPTACIARPDVVRNIKQQISAESVLSAADARLAALSGMIAIPKLGRSGFNDGVIYPPTEAIATPAPSLSNFAAVAAASPSRRAAFRSSSKKVTLNCLVLLVDFPDNVGSAAPADFERLLFDPTNPNSMHSFYKEMSYGSLNVTGQCTSWLRASQPYSHYTDGQSGTGSAHPRNTPGLLLEMLTQYCATRSLAPFDMNGDGFVDGLFLIHAGGGAEAEPNPAKRNDKIWSHKWTLLNPFVNGGVSAYAYFTAPEDGRLGVFSHEFGHFIGLPDLYDTSYRSAGVGDWCLMGGGSWNGDGDRPARLSAWCLSKLDWVKPKVVRSAGSHSLGTLENDKQACLRLWTKGRKQAEYFLVENRQTTGRDAALPGSGVAVWHIDESQSDNGNPAAFMVGLVQADGRRDLELNNNGGDDADLFPGSKRVKNVDDVNPGHPHTRSQSGAATGVALSNIKVASGVATFDVAV